MVSGVIFGVEYLILIEGIKCLTKYFFPQQPKLKTTTNTIIFKFFSKVNHLKGLRVRCFEGSNLLEEKFKVF